MGDLVVELDGTPVGRLVGDWRTFDFHATSEGVQRFGLGASIISLAFPLTIRRVRSGKAARQAFFQGLLPEGRMLEAMAAEARVPVHDTIGLLRRYGRDVAGALQIWDPDVPGEPRAPRREEISETAVAEMLRDTRAQPIGNAPHGGKTSLAGVQDKIVLAEVASSAEGRRWARVLDGYASTHILKPQNPEVPEAIFDEEYGTRLLRAAGLSPFAAEIQDFAGVPALVIERYDRIPGDPPGRLHQEDMAQVLGVVGDTKYQRFGGAASLERSAVAVQKHCEEDSLTRLYAMTVAAVAVGNLDMHAKNISVLHPESVAPTLAPAYDVLPQAHRPTDGELALAVDGVYRHADVTIDNLVAEGDAWSLRRPREIAEETLEALRDAVRREAPPDGAAEVVRSDVRRFVSHLLEGRPVGLSEARRR